MPRRKAKSAKPPSLEEDVATVLAAWRGLRRIRRERDTLRGHRASTARHIEAARARLAAVIDELAVLTRKHAVDAPARLRARTIMRLTRAHFAKALGEPVRHPEVRPSNRPPHGDDDVLAMLRRTAERHGVSYASVARICFSVRHVLTDDMRTFLGLGFDESYAVRHLADRLRPPRPRKELARASR